MLLYPELGHRLRLNSAISSNIWDGYTHQIWQTDASSTSPANDDRLGRWHDTYSTGASLSIPSPRIPTPTTAIISLPSTPTSRPIPQTVATITFNYNITNENVLSAVLTPFPNMAAEDFSLCFYNSMYLNSFPEDLFRYNTQAKNFTRCFEYCGFADVPANLFKYNTQATDFTRCFRDCFMGFTSIPADLFKYNTQAKNFTGCFYNCNQLNSIPKDLFRYNTQAKNFTSCFECCSISSIPAELFRHNTEATNFSHCFSYCGKLTSIPAELFRYNTLATDFTYCFNSCKLYPLFRRAVQIQYVATNFNQCFMHASD